MKNAPLADILEDAWDAQLFRGPKSLAAINGWQVQARLPEHLAQQEPSVVEPQAQPSGLGQSQVGTVVCDLVMEGEPASKERARLGKSGKFYTPKGTWTSEQTLRWQLHAAHVVPDIEHAVRVELEFHCTKGQARDIDNMCKLVLDACNGHVWHDDVQVIELEAKVVRKAEKAATHLRVIRIGRVTKDCERCGKKLGSGAKRFCSRACYDEVQKLGFPTTCPNCGKGIYRQRAERSKLKFCSQECSYAYRRERRSPRDLDAYPTFLLVKDRIVIAETKAERVEPTPEQVEWLDRLARAGGEVYLLRPSDLDEVGLVLGKRWIFDPRTRSLERKDEFLLPGSMWIPGEGRRDSKVAPASKPAQSSLSV